MQAFFALLCIVAVVGAQYAPKEYAPPHYSGPSKKQYEEPIYSPPRPYNFNYAVHDKEQYNDYQREEVSDGQYISGSYKVNLPDGRIQTVSYKAGPGGNVAEVTYEGEAHYPEEKPYVKPEYKPEYKTPYSAPPAYKAAPAYKAPAYAPQYSREPVYEPEYPSYV